ncbi:Riboflavin synthase [bacterium HR19]|nr:Riboflavin synthase [bacterium HR19]
MFSGIVETTGEVVDVKYLNGGGRQITVSVNFNFKKGESVSINGVCLTVVSSNKNKVKFDLSPETLRRTNLRNIKVGDRVNVERALKLTDRISGHFVQGHVLTTLKILDIVRFGEFSRFEFQIKDEIRKYVIEKAFVAIDGVSLTVSEVRAKSFFADIIPETWKITNLRFRRVGDEVNFEPDIIVKVVADLLPDVLKSFLRSEKK